MVFLYYVCKKNKQNYLKRLETDVEFAILFIASEIIGAIEIISIFLLFLIFFEPPYKIAGMKPSDLSLLIWLDEAIVLLVAFKLFI